MIVNREFDCTIIGAGVAGCSLAFTLSRYSNLKSILVLEKYEEPAMLNSHPKSNSQTLHIGDIETNYSLEKATKVKANSSMVANYITHFGFENEIGFRANKMVLAVGDEEINRLKARYEEFKELFPYLEPKTKDELSEIEPLLTKDREEDIYALLAKEQITTVDYKKLSESFLTLALNEDKNLEIHYKEQVIDIKKVGNLYEVTTKNSTYKTKSVVVNASAYSLLFAQHMGYGKHLAILPIGGSFFFTTKKLLNSKVYTMQNPKLPFAAVHADPDLTANFNTRFGPTAFMLPKLERYKQAHIMELLEAMDINKDTLQVYYNLLKDDTIRRYILTNLLDEIPYFGKSVFIKDAKKIIPSLTSDDLIPADGYGGMRPQIVDKNEHKLILGEAKIVEDNIIFNLTPSPGASTSLAIAKEDAIKVCKFLDKKFDFELHQKEISRA